MTEVTEIKAAEITVDCPHCGVKQDGFLVDPRGGVFECEDCWKQYIVSKHADIELF